MDDLSKPEVDELRGELRHARDLIAQMGKLAELGLMTASIIHELNQPLMGIKSFAQIVAKRMLETDPNLARVKVIEQQAIVLETMIGRMRLFVRSARTETMPVSLASVVANATALLEFQLAKRGFSVAWVGGEPATVVAADENQLQQVFVNLFVNARDAMEANASSQKQIKLMASAAADGNTCRVVILDDGSGIEPGARARLFEPFFTTKDADKGTGLGLSVSREIVEGFGGQLNLQPTAETDALGIGARTGFQLLLPLWRDPVAS